MIPLCDLYFCICHATMLLGRVLCSWHVCVNVSHPISIFCPIYYSIKTGGSDTLLPADDSQTMWSALDSWCHLSVRIPAPAQTLMFNHFVMLLLGLAQARLPLLIYARLVYGGKNSLNYPPRTSQPPPPRPTPLFNLRLFTFRC